VWARVLRGTRSPEEAFARIDSSDSEHGRSTRWETIAARPGHWHGSVRIGHDPAIEKDSLLARIRAVELAVVPILSPQELVDVAGDADRDAANAGRQCSLVARFDQHVNVVVLHREVNDAETRGSTPVGSR
jgi:hypothetical protein